MITPDPYFLHEMLAIYMSLTNHTKSTIYAGPPFAASPCGYSSGVQMSGGDEPGYTLPVDLGYDCPRGYTGGALQPGTSLTVHTYEPLLKSGLLTLSAQPVFIERTTDAHGSIIAFRSSGPFDGQWPTIQLHVSSTVPSDR